MGATIHLARVKAAFLAAFGFACIVGAFGPGPVASEGEKPVERDYSLVRAGVAPRSQGPDEVAAKSAGCQSCHTKSDNPSMHDTPAVALGCVDCHGGNPKIVGDASLPHDAPDYVAKRNLAHVLPRYPEAWNWPSSANPIRGYTLLNKEAPEYIRFVNPSDYRVVRQSCGECHIEIIEAAERSLMATGAMLWGGASYNNGLVPYKNYMFGEAYTSKGEPAKVVSPGNPVGTVTDAEKARGALALLYPLPTWHIIPPGDIFRVFERGGRNINPTFPEIGNPGINGAIQRLEEPGRPDLKQSNRGPATGLRAAIPALNIHKTRLNDPYMWFMGTNDQPGDYRSSGCAGCHVVYANDREQRHSLIYAQYGRDGQSITVDPTIADLMEPAHRSSHDVEEEHEKGARAAKGEHGDEHGKMAGGGSDSVPEHAIGYLPRKASGHPLKHEFTKAIPTAQCMNCHMHQPNIFLNSYLGYTMWDYESDAPLMWPHKDNPIAPGSHQKYPTAKERHDVLMRNPEAAAPKGLWSDVDFLRTVYDNVNDKARDTQFADYHGHGWNFRAILKRDRKGNLLDANGNQATYGTETAHIVSPDDPFKFRKPCAEEQNEQQKQLCLSNSPDGKMEAKFVPAGLNPGRSVHMMDIHAEKGLQCADCHFAQDSHGNGLIYGEVANAVEIGCKDCHGTADAFPTLMTSGPAARPGGTNLSLLRNMDGRRRFEWTTDANGERVLIQRSIVDPKIEWKVSLVKEAVDRGSAHFNPRAARAKLMSANGGEDGRFAWGPGVAPEDRAHKPDQMACFTCHLSWTTSCGGCHLPIEANWKTSSHHYDGIETRNFATYNPQVARDEMFQLGKHMTTKGNEVAPIRSTSALVLSSTNINRERIYIQQPPISAAGYSSQAFAPHFPHTVRTEETKKCTDCHLSAADDNNAIMSQLMLLGTNYVNFVGFNAWMGLEGGMQATRVTEWDEPQAVIGSYLQKYAYPDFYQQHQDHGRELINWTRGKALDKHLSGETDSTEQFLNVTHGTPGRVNCLQLRGEYMYVAQGKGGFRAYDVASIANKGFSQKIVSAPFSGLQNATSVSTRNATCMAIPTDQSIAPERNMNIVAHFPENQEQAMHAIYSYAFITDAEEGLIAVNVNTLSDGDPRNNNLKREWTWNENGVLKGARHITLAGDYAYITADVGLVVVRLADPEDQLKLHPTLMAVVPLRDARASAVQFRYLWVTTGEGLQLFDITEMGKPVPMPQATVPLADARKVYLARTYAYVAAGKEGLVIVDITRPLAPQIYQKVTFDGKLSDASDVIVGTTNASAFAYVADGVNGLKVIQLTSPESQPNFYGFSPEPKPELIAWAKTPSPAIALSKGLDRDRAVDETGGQIAIFGRVGSRPFTRSEMEKLFLNRNRIPYKVTDAPDMNAWLPERTAAR